MRFHRLAIAGLALAAAVGACRWSDVAAGSVYHCDQGSCPDGYACQQDYCFATAAAPNNCVPRTCADQGLGCGPVDDGCGVLLDCGGCGDGGVCRGGACCQFPTEAAACAAAGFTCGKLEAKACGQQRVVDCQTCPDAGVCVVTSVGSACAACVPETEAAFCNRQPPFCGTVPATDNCGVPRVFSCDTCADGGGSNGRVPDAGV